MRNVLLALAVSVGALLGVAAPASAITGPQSFTIVFSGDDARVFASGPISGVGIDIENEEEERGTFVFSQGSVEVSHPETGGSEQFNEVACLFTFESEGTYELIGGTGAYEDATGSGTYEVTGIGLLERTANGCGEEPVGFWAVVRATGTTTLP